MKNPMKAIKQWLSFILTGLVVIALFGIIFIQADLVTPSASFFLELGIVSALSVMMKVWWYDYAEDKALNEEDLKKEREDYFKFVDTRVQDTNDLDKYLVILNQENREHFIKTKLGCRTPKNMAKKTHWMCLWHPSYKKLTKEEIGQIRYDKLYFKILRKADKIRPVKSEEIIALSDSVLLYDSKNHLKEKKRAFQTVTTIVSVLLTTFLAMIALKELMLNWENVFRYVFYLVAITFTITWTLLKGYRQTRDETFDYLNRLKFIVDKYDTYKNKEGE